MPNQESGDKLVGITEDRMELTVLRETMPLTLENQRLKSENENLKTNFDNLTIEKEKLEKRTKKSLLIIGLTIFTGAWASFWVTKFLGASEIDPLLSIFMTLGVTVLLVIAIDYFSVI